MIEKIRGWSAPTIFWSAAIAIVLWSAIGFNWFGSGFNWATQTSSTQMASAAVTDRLATICVAQAKADPNITDNLKELGEMSSWKRRKYVEESNWAVMPGSDRTDSGVPALCAEKLLNT